MKNYAFYLQPTTGEIVRATSGVRDGVLTAIIELDRRSCLVVALPVFGALLGHATDLQTDLPIKLTSSQLTEAYAQLAESESNDQNVI